MSTPKTNQHLPDGFRHRTLNWELARGFGQSPLATISMAVPFIGFTILYHAELGAYFGDLGGLLKSQEIALGSNSERVAASDYAILSFYTRLNLIYIGAVLIGVGTILYRVIAPKTVREFSSITKFVESELSRATARRLRSMFVTVGTRRPTVAAELATIAPWIDRDHCNLKVAVGELKSLKDDQIQIDILSSFYNVESRYSSRWAVYVTMLFYVLGLSLISIPGLFFTYRVLRVILLS